ncbi:MAG: hypothetical protein ILO68_03170 [Clostridia bacterium]|nr:hypothetical protein [Clostridia bacterium]
MSEKDLREQLPGQPLNDAAEDMTEAEKQEILSVFDEQAQLDRSRNRRSGFRFTVKNQLILIGAVLAVAAILLTCYFIFLRKEEEPDPFYVLSEETQRVLEGLDERVEIRFDGYPESEYAEELSEERHRVYRFAQLYGEASRRVRVEIGETSGDARVTVSCGSGKETIPLSDFHRARSSDGAVYGFDGESLLTNAILSLTGKERLSIDVRPLDGFDKDGDTVLASGGVVMFPMVNRDNISILNIRNGNGTYTIYQEKGTFYFQGCEALEFDEEKFASLIVDCRYMVTAGKMEDHLDYAVYGLDSEENGSCVYTLVTNPDKEGNCLFHSVRIGKKAASGGYYYALYHGGKMNAENKVIESYSNPKIYMIPYGNVEENLLRRKEDYFNANLVYGVSKTEDCYSVDHIHMDYYDRDGETLSIVVRNMTSVLFSDNIASNDGDAVNVLKDKTSYSDTGKTYSDWLGEQDKGYFVGLTSSDGNEFTVTAVVTNVASDGKYECRFGLVKDLQNGTYPALLPDAVSVRISPDGEIFRKLPGVSLDFSGQEDKTVKQYRFTVESDEPVLLIELSFRMPRTVGYLVMDEIRVYADGEDAVPADALTGVWRMVQPSSMIPAGKNFSYLDSTNFADFLYGICMLKGDSVARVGISSRDSSGRGSDVINGEILAEYGLDNPSMHFSYEFDGYRTDLYLSAYNPEDGCYYAYSTITGDVYGTGIPVTFCTGMVATVTTATASWLEWDPLEYIDRQLFDIYVYDLTEMTIAYEGKEYAIEISADGSTLQSVRCNGEELNERNFRYLYLSIVQLNLKNGYQPAEGDKPEEYLRISVRSRTDRRDYVFYRVSPTKAYYTINGEGSYYCLVSALRNVMRKTDLFVAGEDVDR